MTWNWQHKDWPEFRYNADQFSDFEKEFLRKSGVMTGSLKHIRSDDRQALQIRLMSEEAYKTSEIEGEILDRRSLRSSIRKHFGLSTDTIKISPAEAGISEMLVDLYRNYDDELTHESLHEWHEMLTNGRRDLVNIGSYRSHEDPMEIVSGYEHKRKVHFVAPPSETVSHEMERFIAWFNKSRGELPFLVRSGIAHIYFESIHPYEDGNGRMGRAISEKALSQGLGERTLPALSIVIQRSKKDYYEALHQASKTLDMNLWLEYYCELVIQAQQYTQNMIDFLIEKASFYDQFADKLNDRQKKVISRMFKEGVDGFKGGLSAENYISITGAPRATATRDLQGLVLSGAFTKTGERKSTRYYLNIENVRINP